MLVAKEWSSHKQQRDRAAKIDVRVGGVLRPADLAGETGGRTVTTGSARIERNLDRAHT